MGKLRSKKSGGVVVVKKGRSGFGTGVTLDFNKSLVLHASARDCVEFAASALLDWYAEAHRTGQRYDKGLLPRDSSGWVGYDTGLTAGTWRITVSGDDRTAGARVYLNPPDQGRRLRIAQLSKQGIHFSGLDGKALDVYSKAVATYMADALSAE